MSEPLDGRVIAQLGPYADRKSLERMRVVTRRPWRWLPVLLRTGAVTLGSRVVFREGRFRPDTARGLALIAHEAGHIGQYGEMGPWRFATSYAVGLVRCGFRHDRHPMEAGLVDLQRRVRRALREAGLPDR